MCAFTRTPVGKGLGVHSLVPERPREPSACGVAVNQIAFEIVEYECRIHIPDSSVDPDQHALAVHVLGHSSKAVRELGAVDL